MECKRKDIHLGSQGVSSECTRRDWAEHHFRSMDPCMHPRHTHLTGFLSSHGKGPGPKKELFPVLAICKTPLHSDVLAVRPEHQG